MFLLTHLLGFGVRRALPVITLVVTTNQIGGYNVFTAAGSPSYPCEVRLTVQTGVLISELRALGFAPGSKIVLVNDGKIYGRGGAGGVGGGDGLANGGNGTNGTDAIQSNVPIEIDNNNGYIWAGGGGGGGGGYANDTNDFVIGQDCGGGGGGGGAGSGAPGGRGISNLNSPAWDGQSGDTGVSSPTTEGSAAGGLGYVVNGSFYGGDGGVGGSWGADGSAGANAIGIGNMGVSGIGGLAGLAGKAVHTNGAGVTWIRGNNGTQVKGVAS